MKLPLDVLLKKIESSEGHTHLECPLFGHKKHTGVCVSLRARKICKEECKLFAGWSLRNPDLVRSTIEEKLDIIKRHLHAIDVSVDSILSTVLPKGSVEEFVCEFCKKDFEDNRDLQKHLYRKHWKEMKK